MQPLDYTSPPARLPALTVDPRDSTRKAVSRFMFALCIACAAMIVGALLLVTGDILYRGIRGLSLSFFTNSFIADGSAAGAPGGMLHGILGTLILVALASAIGIPVGIMAGVYLAEYTSGSWLAKPARFIADVLAGVPSIVVGVLGYELVVVPMGRNFSGWAGAAALAFIMIPIVARTTEEMLRLVPASYREASIALGASKARTILRVVLPSATGSVITGIMLAVARVAGETAPLIFTALSASAVELNPSHQFPSLTVLIYKASQADRPERQQLAQTGILVLVVLIFALNLLIRYLARSRKPA